MHHTIHSSSNSGHQTSMKQEIAVEFPKLYHSSRHLESSHSPSEEGETFGVMLRKSRSVPSASTVVLRAEKQSTALESAVRRAFSMRRSRSTSSPSCVSRGGYYKIFHHLDDHNDSVAVSEVHNVAVKSRKNRASKILEACKRVMGF